MSTVRKTPQSTYTGPILVDPLTRVEGHLRIEVEVENGRIKDARSTGTLFRGIEMILKGRDPRDAQHFTQRACGVCTYTHALASTYALENAIGVEVPKNAQLLRNMVMSLQIMHDHIVHFYHLHLLDFVDVVSALQADPAKAAGLASAFSSRPATAKEFRDVQDRLKTFVAGGQLGPFTNAYFLGGHEAYYLTPEENLIGITHYMEALRLQILAARATAVFGGKNPHTQFLVAGGVTSYESLTKERISEFEDLYNAVEAFVEHVYMADIRLLGRTYSDWARMGGNKNFLTFGGFPPPDDPETNFLPAGLLLNADMKNVAPFDPGKIAEHVKHSWYEGEIPRHPYEGETLPRFTALDDRDRYSWIKAPRYDGQMVEVGPLAQVLVSYAQGHQETRPVVDELLAFWGTDIDSLYSTLGRTAGRAMDSLIIVRKTADWLKEYKENIATDQKLVEPCDVPDKAEGVGFVHAPRGALSHWIRIENKKIANFQLVVPSTWNLGPRCAAGKRGAVEESLIGLPVADPKRPVEILRNVHSFDPCMACSIHVIDGQTNEVHKFRVM